MELNELLIYLQNDEMDYFDLFYEQTKKQVFYMIYSITKNHAISEDLLQDTYIKFLKYKNKVNPKQNILAYLLQIAKTIAYNFMKRNKKIHLVDDDTSLDVVDENNHQEHNDLLNIMKGILNPLEFQVVVLHIVDDLTHKQISEILNKPLGTITWMYANALKKVRRKLDDGKQN